MVAKQETKEKKKAGAAEKMEAKAKGKAEKNVVAKEEVAKKEEEKAGLKKDVKTEKSAKGEKKAEKKDAKEKAPKIEATREEQLEAYKVIAFPLITEKAVNMIETENKLVFIVKGDATKTTVRKAVEALYGVKVDKVNIVRDMKARKRALVKINESFKADDIATKLGIL